MSTNNSAFKRSQSDYIYRINKVMDYIEDNISTELSLDKLASEANFSKFHFHRIFSAITGEKLSEFIWRVRIERAACNLVFKQNESITDIALFYGFANSQIFSRRFKQRFNMTATEYRKKNKVLNYSKKIIDSKSLENEITFESGELPKVKISDFEETKLLYVRYTGSYAMSEEVFINLYNKLFNWVGNRNIVIDTFRLYIIYHDHPETTNENKLRISMCLPIKDEIKTGGEIGSTSLKTGKHMFATFKIKTYEFQKAWDWIYRNWLPNSGYEPTNNPAFEYYDKMGTDENGFIDVTICIPIRKI